MTLLAKPALAGSKQSVKLASRNPHRKSIKMFKRVGVFTKNDGPAVAETFNTTITVLKKRGCEVFLCGDIPKGIHLLPTVPQIGFSRLRWGIRQARVVMCKSST